MGVPALYILAMSTIRLDATRADTIAIYENENRGREIWYWCPGCDSHHVLSQRGYPLPEHAQGSWELRGDQIAPTLTPSVMSTSSPQRGALYVCHHWVKGGKIEYLPDSTHALKGQTIDMSPIIDSIGE